jgi:anti-sigma factor RsiW
VLLLALSIALLKGLMLPGGSFEARLLSVPVQDLHTFVVSQRSLDVTSPDPQHLRQWFQGKVDFSPPLLPRQVGTATLVGGRLCSFLDRRVAAFMYTVDGHYLSLYVMPRHGLPALPRASVRRAGHAARTYTVQGYTQIIWSHTDLLYALVSDLPSATLLALARGLAEAGEGRLGSAAALHP